MEHDENENNDIQIFNAEETARKYVTEFAELGYELDESLAVESALALASEYDMDESLNPQGTLIARVLLGLNLFLVSSVKPIFIGSVNNLESDITGLKLRLLEAKSSVVRTAGEITAVGADITSTDAIYKEFAFLSRKKTIQHVVGTTSLTFNLKATDTDATNYQMQRGMNSVSVLGYKLEDYETDSKGSISKRYATLTNEDETTFDVEAIFDYTAGTIEVNFTNGEPLADTNIFFRASLDTTNIDEIAGAISSKIEPTTFVAQRVVLDIVGRLFDIREMGAMGISAKQISTLMATSKIENELIMNLMLELFSMGKEIAGVIDVQNAVENTTVHDRYGNLIKAILNAHSDIVTKSGENGVCCIVGGSAIFDIVNSLSTSNNAGQKDFTASKGSDRGIRKISVIGGGRIIAYYMPTFDDLFPITNGESKICVTNAPSDTLKRPVLTGIGLPLMPDTDNITELSGATTTRLSGSFVAEANPTSNLSEQVRFITALL